MLGLLNLLLVLFCGDSLLMQSCNAGGIYYNLKCDNKCVWYLFYFSQVDSLYHLSLPPKFPSSGCSKLYTSSWAPKLISLNLRQWARSQFQWTYFGSLGISGSQQLSDSPFHTACAYTHSFSFSSNNSSHYFRPMSSKLVPVVEFEFVQHPLCNCPASHSHLHM